MVNKKNAREVDEAGLTEFGGDIFPMGLIMVFPFTTCIENEPQPHKAAIPLTPVAIVKFLTFNLFYGHPS